MKYTKKELNEYLDYYEHFKNYVQRNNYSTYCNAMDYAIKQTENNN